MSDAYLGEIRIFAGTYAPRNWILCNGQLIDISKNPELFSIIGNAYGGDGRSSMEVPNLMGRAVVNEGRGPGLSSYFRGMTTGLAGVSLTEGHMPKHDHQFNIDKKKPDTPSASPANGVLANVSAKIYADKTDNLAPMADRAVSDYGQSQAHENRQPSLGLNFILCIEGLYPPHS